MVVPAANADGGFEFEVSVMRKLLVRSNNTSKSTWFLATEARCEPGCNHDDRAVVLWLDSAAF